MKYFVATISFLFMGIGIVQAQESIGFENPDDIQSILDYRLPDWGYSNFILDFNAVTSGRRDKFGDLKSSQNSTDLMAAPGYILFKESENRIFELNTSLNLLYDNTNSDDIFVINNPSFSFFNVENENKVLDINYSFNTILREYVADESFIFLEAPTNLSYRSLKNVDEQGGNLQNNRIDYNRIFTSTPRVGFGFGRIRNVTPVIRALRLKERYDALNKLSEFNNQDILSAADQFTRFEGYQRNYDRPEKYFWGDLDDKLSTNLSNLGNFDFLYLTDVLDEALGTRQEGWEVIGGIQFDYLNGLLRLEERLDGFTFRNTQIFKELGGFVSARWFKNTSLKNQWGLFADAVVEFPLGEQEETPQGETKSNIVLSGGINWLWNISDRVLIQSTLSDQYIRTKREFSDFFGGSSPEFTTWINELSLNTSLNLFVENSLQLTITARPSLLHTGDTEDGDTLNFRSFSWQASAGLRYYFSRNLY